MLPVKCFSKKQNLNSPAYGRGILLWRDLFENFYVIPKRELGAPTPYSKEKLCPTTWASWQKSTIHLMIFKRRTLKYWHR